MRSILIIFGTLVLVAIGFFAYLFFQTGSSSTVNSGQESTTQETVIAPASRPTEVPDPEHIDGAGNGQNAWMRNIDEKTGLLANEFRATKYEPRKDGTIDVTDPEAKFYLGTAEPRQMLVVRGKTGKVFVPDSGNGRNSSAGSSSPMRAGTQAPTRGKLKDVTLLLYPSADAPEPTLTCTMDNAAFDQETFKIYTEDFEHNGKMVAADQVPVAVRGVDYDFDGRGLELRWNERDRRLQQLEIAHGERLVVKHPNAMGGGGFGGLGGAKSPATQPATTTNPPVSLLPESEMLPLLASADSASAGEAIKGDSIAASDRKKKKPASEPVVAPVKIVRDKTAPIFRATFFDNVRIFQGEDQMAAAKIMHVDFVMENSSTTKPTTEPDATATETKPPAPAAGTAEPKSITAAKKKTAAAAPAAAAPAPTVVAATTPAEKKHTHRTPATGPTTRSVGAPSSAPTTEPAEQPVTIYWTGILRVTPLDAAMPDPPTKNDSTVTLLGDPVVLTHTGSRVDAASVRYRTGNSSVLMESSTTVQQVVMHDVNGSVIHTPSLQFDGENNIAILRGVSQADLVMKAPPTTQTTQPAVAAAPPTPMHATWTRTCRLFMNGDVKNNMTIDRAEIDGDVTIDHPQIKGKSDSLELAFQQLPTTRPAAPDATTPATEADLKNLVAIGHVHYTMVSAEEGKSQMIDCSQLNLETAKDDQNKTYARTINAQGSVHTYSAQQDLRCGTLALKLLPTTKPANSDQDQQSPPDDSGMSNSSTTVESMTADQNVQVSSAAGDTATCDRLTLDTKDGLREIVLIGEPMAHVAQKGSTIAGPIIRIDPDSNKAYVVGAGMMHAIQQTASGKPQPIDVSWAGNMDANGNDNVVNINEHVAIHSISSDGSINDATSDRLKLTLMDDPRAATRPASQPDTNSPMAQAGFGNTNFFKDKVVQLVELDDHVRVTSVLNDAKGALLRQMLLKTSKLTYDMTTKTMIVPVPGQMFMQDLGKSPTTQASQQPLGDMGGATAFEWQHELRYSDLEHHMAMSGDVHVEHQSGGDSQPFTLHCQTLTADLEPAPTTQELADAAAGQPVTEPATTQSTTRPSGGKMRVQHVTATDQVDFTSHPMHFQASSIDYDPNTHEMIAKGSNRVRAEMFDDKGEANSSFMEMHYNTQTGQTQMADLRAVVSH